MVRVVFINHSSADITSLSKQPGSRMEAVPTTSWQGSQAEGLCQVLGGEPGYADGELQKPGSGTYTGTITQAQQTSGESGSSERDYVGSLIEAQLRCARIFSGHTEIRKVSQ